MIYYVGMVVSSRHPTTRKLFQNFVYKSVKQTLNEQHFKEQLSTLRAF